MISVTRGVGVKNRRKIAIHFGGKTTRHVSLTEAVALSHKLIDVVNVMIRVGRTP